MQAAYTLRLCALAGNFFDFVGATARTKRISRKGAKAQGFLLALLGCIALGCMQQANGQSRLPLVRVGAENVARHDRLVLGDLAQIANADSETADRLRAIPLGYAPEVGALRELSKEKIALAITAAGFATGTVTLDAPLVVLIRRESQLVNPDLVHAAVERAALAGLQAKGATARIVRLDLPSRIEVRTGAIEVRASIGGAKNLFAPFMVSLEFWIDGRIARRTSTTAQVEAYAPVLVAAHDLAAKTRLRAGDFVIETMRLERDVNIYVSEPTPLRGVMLTSAISRGQPITRDSFIPDIVVKPGDPVQISGQSGSLKISVAGEARAAGHIGDRIQVKNLQSGLLFQAIIVDEGIVSVRF
jgi:flagella basal body P-ring formation protein FlgA